VTKDFSDFLLSLNREGVAYVVIGGIAVLAHVPYRTTRDLDILIEPSLENAEKTRRAVAVLLEELAKNPVKRPNVPDVSVNR
jgi:hypothetical protein